MPLNDKLSNRLEGLPLVIAGPILRRVDNKSVTVWVATKNSSRVRLTILDENAQEIMSSETQTRVFGQYLHVLAITAANAQPALDPNKVYFYNLYFDGVPMITPSGSLSNGIIESDTYTLSGGLAYADYEYPSFILPSDDLNHLKLIHGSCRKPHGGDTDALKGLDAIIEDTVIPLTILAGLPDNSRKEKVNQRPQFFCLTGDQIYADDVADALLCMLIDASMHLLGWTSSNQAVSEELPLDIPNQQLMPGERQRVVAPQPDKSTLGAFSSSHAKSHLITLGEFYTMYLFVWSDVLWPDVLPDFKETYGRDPVYLKVSDSYFAENVIETKGVDLAKESLNLAIFKDSLPLVRRALANIPTYMIFDDHDVTDDWFISKEWAENAMVEDSISRRIIQNGLAAYAIFQAWGNAPAQFLAQAGQLLNALEFLNRPHTLNSDQWENIGEILLPRLEDNRLIGGLQWHYRLEYSTFRLIVLDTRTRRNFPSENRFAAELIAIENMHEQLQNNTENVDLTLVVSPANFITETYTEYAKKVMTSKLPGTNLVLGTPYGYDIEEWSSNQVGFHAFIIRLVEFERVLIITGDVHYGSSMTGKFLDNRTSPFSHKVAHIGQVCASSFKNSEGKTKSLGAFGSDTSLVTLEIAPEVSFEYRFLRDSRINALRGLPSTVIKSNNRPQENACKIHGALIKGDGQRTIIGYDNIGVVSFNWVHTVKRAYHQIYFPGRVSGSANSFPFTFHEVYLGESSNS